MGGGRFWDDGHFLKEGEADGCANSMSLIF